MSVADLSIDQKTEALLEALPYICEFVGKTIVVKGDQGPVSFALGTAAHVVDGAGKVVTAPLHTGQKVRVYYRGPTESRTVERVVVED